jgi:hypothetical protein
MKYLKPDYGVRLGSLLYSRSLKPAGTSNTSPSPISRTMLRVPSQTAVQCLQFLKCASILARSSGLRSPSIIGDLAPNLNTTDFDKHPSLCFGRATGYQGPNLLVIASVHSTSIESRGERIAHL